jgi:bisphosphoglycerate-independent phosphoglycerate mutase (AlkP superfamily)
MREGGNETIYNPGQLQNTMGALLICHTLGRSNAFHLPVVENNPHFSFFLNGIDFAVFRQVNKLFMSLTV